MTDTNDPLHDETLFVRPPGERIPAALFGTQAGSVYGELVRWHDGCEHAGRRERVERFIDSLDADRLGEEAAEAAAAAVDARAARYDVPLGVIARAVGVAPGHIDRAVALARSAARGMGPGATGDPQEAIAAVPGLLELVPGDETLDAANRIGLLLQTCDAVAALVARASTRAGDDTGGPIGSRRLVEAVLADDPPVRVARRFLSDGVPVPVDICGRPFGAGPHRCPGERLAVALAAGTVAGLE